MGRIPVVHQGSNIDDSIAIFGTATVNRNQTYVKNIKGVPLWGGVL